MTSYDQPGYPKHSRYTFSHYDPIVIFLFCTADASSESVNSFLSQANLKPDTNDVFFHFATQRDLIINDDTKLWTHPPVSTQNNDFINMDIAELSKWTEGVGEGKPDWWRFFIFVVLDQRSFKDETAVLVNTYKDGTFRSVRCGFRGVLEAAVNHSNRFKPDIRSMQECVDDDGVDTLYVR